MIQSNPPPSPLRQKASRKRAAFTLIEVMAAAFVMVLVLASSITVLTRCFDMLDTARNSTIAAQLMQTEIEKLRLMHWGTISGKVGAPNTTTISNPQMATFTVTSNITPDSARPLTMLRIDLQAVWRGRNGVQHTRKLGTRYSQHGLSDYYVTRHPQQAL